MDFGQAGLSGLIAAPLIWYEIDGYDINQNGIVDSDELVAEDRNRWIVSRLPDIEATVTSGAISATALSPSYLYIVGDTEDNNLPCDMLSEYEGELLFTYNRERAVSVAIAQSENNEVLAGDTNPYTRATYRIDSLIFANFDYALNFGEAGRTASAVFMSEMLWYGGLPMLQTNEACADDTAWRYCPNSNAALRGNPSDSWDTHDSLIEYYTFDTGVPVGAMSGDNRNFLDDLNESVLGEQINPDVPQDDGSSISRGTVLDFINEQTLRAGGSESEEGFDAQGLSDWFESNFSQGNQIVAGDYVWINSGGSVGASADDHGLLVVGWSVATTCEIALENSPTLYLTRQAVADPNVAVIPFVSDFNRLQRPSARPFFCTDYADPEGRVEGNENYFGGDHSWWFYKMPEQLAVQSSSIYTPDKWFWGSASGAR